MCVSCCHVQLFAIPWTVSCQAPLSMEFPKQEYCSRLPFPSPGDLPYPGIEPSSPALQVDASPWSHQGSPWFCKTNVKARTERWTHHIFKKTNYIPVKKNKKQNPSLGIYGTQTDTVYNTMKFTRSDEIKTVLHVHKLKEFVTSRPALHEILNKLVQM